MNDIFITKIHIHHLRHLQGITIDIHDTERRPLLLTGGNGSGKTSLLIEMDKYMQGLKGKAFDKYKNDLKMYENNLENAIGIKHHFSTQAEFDNYIRNINLNIEQLKEKLNIEIEISSNEIWIDKTSQQALLLKTFTAVRKTEKQVLKGISNVTFNKESIENSRLEVNSVFLQYIVNLKANRSFARDANNTAEVAKIDKWFLRFETMLKEIFNDAALNLEFDYKKYNFLIHTKNRNPFDFNTLSDGYAAFIHIITEIIMRMESKEVMAYDLEGIVLIDELETHLHIDLQKKVLPFLIAFFPKIQFIITTHSPFVLSSVKDAIVYDLAQQLRIEDMSGYSVEAIIEGYYDNNKYSETLTKQLQDYENLLRKPVWTDDDQIEIKTQQYYFKNLPKFFAPELEVQIQLLENLRRERIFQLNQ